MRKIEAVLFDCDGVVVDSDPLQQQAEQQTAVTFAERHGLSYDPDRVDWPNMKGWARRKIASNIYGFPADSELADLFRLAVVDTTVEIVCAENAPLVDGVTAFAGYLMLQGVKLGLATNSHRSIYERYCDVNATHLFPAQFSVAYGECAAIKPHPASYLELMRRMGIRPENAAVIEDSASGIEAGRHSGSGMVIGLASTQPKEKLQNHSDAHVVAEDFRHAAYLLQPFLR